MRHQRPICPHCAHRYSVDESYSMAETIRGYLRGLPASAREKHRATAIKRGAVRGVAAAVINSRFVDLSKREFPPWRVLRMGTDAERAGAKRRRLQWLCACAQCGITRLIRTDYLMHRPPACTECARAAAMEQIADA